MILFVTYISLSHNWFSVSVCLDEKCSQFNVFLKWTLSAEWSLAISCFKPKFTLDSYASPVTPILTHASLCCPHYICLQMDVEEQKNSCSNASCCNSCSVREFFTLNCQFEASEFCIKKIFGKLGSSTFVLLLSQMPLEAFCCSFCVIGDTFES